MSLVPDYDTSDSSEESESEDARSNVEHIVKINEKLPTPKFIHDTEEVKISKSIFINPYVEAQNAETAKLERHVKMVKKIDDLEMINGKKICWNHRKGKCRFGSNCKYAHGTEIQRSVEQVQSEQQNSQMHLYNSKSLSQTKEIKQIKGMKKSKRPGLSQNLIPSKKVMKDYFKNK